MVARARSIFRLHAPAGTLALSWCPTTESSTTALGAGVPLAAQWRITDKTGKVVHSRIAQLCPGELVAPNPASPGRRFLVLALDVSLRPFSKTTAATRRNARNGSRRECDLTVALEPRGRRKERCSSEKRRETLLRLAAR